MQQNVTNDKKGRDLLISALQDAYALENQLVETLSKQEQMKGAPAQFQAKIHEHLEQTKQHRDRVEQCLSQYGEKPSGLKSALSALGGNVQGAMSGARTEALAMTGRDDYVAENMEIATYVHLITMARALGDEQTAQACEMNLRDEVMMAKWLENHMAEATLISMSDEGVSVAQGSIPAMAQQSQNLMTQLWSEADRGLAIA